MLILGKSAHKISVFMEQHNFLVVPEVARSTFFETKTLKELQDIVDRTNTKLKKRSSLTGKSADTVAYASTLMKAAASSSKELVTVVWGIHQLEKRPEGVGEMKHFTVTYANITWHLYLKLSGGTLSYTIGSLSRGPTKKDVATVTND
jgi:hypothetical protein